MWVLRVGHRKMCMTKLVQQTVIKSIRTKREQIAALREELQDLNDYLDGLEARARGIARRGGRTTNRCRAEVRRATPQGPGRGRSFKSPTQPRFERNRRSHGPEENRRSRSQKERNPRAG